MDIARLIQSSIAPVFLFSGVAATLSVLTNRLSRIVDRARAPVNGNIILALLDGAFTVKRYRTKDGAMWLQAENPAFVDMQLADGQSFEVWGVITRSIRML